MYRHATVNVDGGVLANRRERRAAAARTRLPVARQCACCAVPAEGRGTHDHASARHGAAGAST